MIAASRPRPAVVHIATSAGGHIELTHAVRAAFEGYGRSWVAQPSLRAELLARQGERVTVLPEYDRHPIRGGHLANILRAARVVARERPRIVVTTGAGATVPFCALARLAGARVVFVETMARVVVPSASGRVLSRLASRVLVQWPEVARHYPRVTVCRPALLRAVGTRPAPPGEGVFVGVGTHSQQFDRLLRLVDEAVASGVLPGPVVAQGGSSTYRPLHYRLRDWLTPDEIVDAIQGARYVVTHAGSGLLSAALRAGRRPLVLPRLARHGEHYDDHQTQIVAKLADLGLAVPLQDVIGPADLAAARTPLPAPSAWSGEPTVEDALAEEIAAVLGPPRCGAPEAATHIAPAPTTPQRRVA